MARRRFMLAPFEKRRLASCALWHFALSGTSRRWESGAVWQFLPLHAVTATGNRPAVQAYRRGAASNHRMPTNLARKRSIDSMTAVPPANEIPDRDADARLADARLIERARAGDVDAFEHVYRKEVGRVYALCLRMTGDPIRARELTQSVFVRAWDRLASFRGDSQLSSWLHRIAVNEVLVEARTDRRRRARVVLAEDYATEDAPEKSGAPSSAPNALGIAMPEDTETRIDLERAIAGLPPGARTVFVLHDIEGYRHEEISRMTGSAEGTLRAQLHRARKLLMEALSR
jgi:RNA polymerase sigma-70 factor, ECF subfamily